MSLRNTLNKNPLIVSAVVLAAAALTVYLACASMRPEQVHVPTQAYFTIDDGKTLFTDDRDLVPPFSHDGKEAVRAAVFTCDSGKTRFVAYLEKFTPTYKAAREAATKQLPDEKAPLANGSSPRSHPAAVPASAGGPLPLNLLVKKPGGTNWVPMTGREGFAILTGTTCPDGAGHRPERVQP